MVSQKNYKKTLYACYLGFASQAISANFVPLLFLTFKSTYGISFEKLALIPMVFYLSQLVIDLLATRYADKIGYRTCVVASQLTSALGLACMAFLPEVLPSPFVGILISVVLYSVGSGLVEVLVSPIVEACPFENKEGAMSLLHSFYCWGTVTVILGSTLFFSLFGLNNWKILAILWALIPLVNSLNFLKCPIEKLTEDGESMGILNLLKMPLFWLLILLMVCAGSSETSMAQWASAFTESALGVPKAVGDLAGPCLFALFMGVSRLLYGKCSEKLDLIRVMLVCGVLGTGCYLLAGLSVLPILGLVGCAVCGFAVGIMWPGSISLSSKMCPKGGTAMFAFLALAGDFGGTVSPAMVGSVAESSGGNLQTGLLMATVFPALMIPILLLLRKAGRSKTD